MSCYDLNVVKKIREIRNKRKSVKTKRLSHQATNCYDLENVRQRAKNSCKRRK